MYKNFLYRCVFEKVSELSSKIALIFICLPPWYPYDGTFSHFALIIWIRFCRWPMYPWNKFHGQFWFEGPVRIRKDKRTYVRILVLVRPALLSSMSPWESRQRSIPIDNEESETTRPQELWILANSQQLVVDLEHLDPRKHFLLKYLHTMSLLHWILGHLPNKTEM